MSTVYIKENSVKGGFLTIARDGFSFKPEQLCIQRSSVCILIKEINKTIQNRKTAGNMMQAI